jgi:hypothetical protein
MNIAIVISIVATVIAFIALVVSWQQVRKAHQAIRQASLQQLFAAFNLASQASLEDPKLLYDVHGLDRTVPMEEARKIAYLSLLMDGFQHFYGEVYGGDFRKMAKTLKGKSTFLNRILAIMVNQERWNTLKKLYYGDFDASFIKAIDNLIEYENSKKTNHV